MGSPKFRNFLTKKLFGQFEKNPPVKHVGIIAHSEFTILINEKSNDYIKSDLWTQLCTAKFPT